VVEVDRTQPADAGLNPGLTELRFSVIVTTVVVSPELPILFSLTAGVPSAVREAASLAGQDLGMQPVLAVAPVPEPSPNVVLSPMQMILPRPVPAAMRAMAARVLLNCVALKLNCPGISIAPAVVTIFL
jgi:hypothetical protein